ncbi:MAG: fructose-6-phosphate aldolase [Rhodospirillales bacterium]|jgi:transaldolase|nr:fructose-6-phosphate aldolase [Rhodospirillales bacterium]MBT5429016.1 fructose-6-phosphate aldolase [Rhodospirillaceae bacterium]|tara:strand:- start:5281 stop:5937 length:657 start_codon:yes stop_codon:yes gene_type:complete
MKFFIDSADVEEIQNLTDTGLIDGVTTNPSLITKTGRNFLTVIEEICSIVSGPVSAEVTATDYETMIREGEKLSSLGTNVAVKVPLTFDGLKACKILSDKKIMVNVTLCFSSSQAILAAKAGATFVSPFVGRLDDIALDGMDLISDICEIYSNYPSIKTEVLVASVRSSKHVTEAGRLGADIVTIPGQTLRQLYDHPLTDKGLDAFLKDWEKGGQSIL